MNVRRLVLLLCVFSAILSSRRMGAQEAGSIILTKLSPAARDGDDEPIPGSDRFLPYPAPNRLVETDYRQRLAWREFTVSLQPVAKFANTQVRVEISGSSASLNLGVLPAGVPGIETAKDGVIQLDGNAEARLRVNCPPIGYNHLDLTLTSLKDPSVARKARFVVPIVVVIDPGHGGTTDEPGSSWNNARGGATGAYEKEVALRFSLGVRDALREWCERKGMPARLLITREEDVNLPCAQRAGLARDAGADRLLVIHLNANGGKARGSLNVVRIDGDVNRKEDDLFADVVLNACVGALQVFDSAAYRRSAVVFPEFPGLNRDDRMGNYRDYHPVRLCYLEMEFLDNPAIDRLLNAGEKKEQLRMAVCQAMAEAILKDAMGGREYGGLFEPGTK